MSLDFIFGLPADDKGNTGILVFVCRLSKMVRLAPVRDKVTGKQAAQLFLDCVFRYHGLPETIVSDRDPRFTGAFWDSVNAPMELSSLTTKSVLILTKDLKDPRLASLRGSLTTRSKPKGYLDRENAISKLTDLIA
ncbi:RNA-directed DNA polymerase [Phytophthora palmivora]|uniref:RNA-directed DNA polymerase n=1 Tax=Phytophthora palmivora TaxID=4796 RepID=A0A2P4YPI3_9STRA|nr:RNA-directed DNA polymerase [Phytophthora palmivora]